MEYFKKSNDYYMKCLKKGNDCYNEQDYKGAIANYNKAAKNRDNQITCIHNIALCYIKQKKYKKAIPLLEFTAAKNPTGNYFFNLAYGYVTVKNFKKALIYFNRAWALSPENKKCEIMINYILGLYENRGNLDKFV